MYSKVCYITQTGIPSEVNMEWKKGFDHEPTERGHFPIFGITIGRHDNAIEVCTTPRDRAVAMAAPDLLDVLKAALAQTGRDGGLCCYEWHERARRLIAEIEKNAVAEIEWS